MRLTQLQGAAKRWVTTRCRSVAAVLIFAGGRGKPDSAMVLPSSSVHPKHHSSVQPSPEVSHFP